MLFFPNSKINIGLNILNKRSDGYHNIETVFCPIGLADVLEFVPLPDNPAGTARFTSTGIIIDGPAEKNLCVKAYNLLHKIFNLPAIDIHLHKIIPPGAGLGGGSADAAFMLYNLNKAFRLNLSEAQLCDYASQLGSDCAFFIRNKPLFGYERGNLFREIRDFTNGLQAVVVNPGIHVSTAEAYSGVHPCNPVTPLEELIKQPIERWKDNIVNDFEESIIQKHPGIGIIKNQLYKSGAVYASMSGSGSSVYGLFKGTAPDLTGLFPGYFCWKGKLAPEV